MSETNPSVLDSRDTPDTTQEISQAVNKISAEEQAGTFKADDQVVDVQAPAEGPPSLPWYFAEKYEWRTAPSGKHYLVAKGDFLDYVLEKVEGALKFGIKKAFPDGKKDATTEGALTIKLIKSTKDLLELRGALHDRERNATTKHLLERCTSNATYAAVSQFELRNWAMRLAAKGEDAGKDTAYCDKQSRLEAFAIIAAVDYAVLCDVAPDAKLEDPVTFTRAAANILRRNADFAKNDVLTPAQLDEQTQAGVDAAVLTAESF